LILFSFLVLLSFSRRVIVAAIVVQRNPSFIPLAKKVIIWFGREKPAVTVNTLVTRLSSLNPAPKVTSGGSCSNLRRTMDSPCSSVRTNGLPSAFSLVMPDTATYPTPARGHLALIFLAELAFELSHEFLLHLPVIMHQVRYDSVLFPHCLSFLLNPAFSVSQVFLGFDYPQQVVFEHCRLLLLNLIHSLVVEDIGYRGAHNSASLSLSLYHLSR